MLPELTPTHIKQQPGRSKALFGLFRMLHQPSQLPNMTSISVLRTALTPEIGLGVKAAETMVLRVLDKAISQNQVLWV